MTKTKTHWMRGAAKIAFLAVSLSFIASPAARAEQYLVVIKNFEFEPSDLILKAGDEVTFRNDDIVPHTATAKTEESAPGYWDSGLLETGQSWVLKIEDRTVADYFCLFHPTMEGRLSKTSP